MQPKGGRARLRARPPFRYAFYSQNPQKCLRGGFFEGFRGPREGFLRVFQNFWGRRRVFLGFFEGFLLALENVPKTWKSLRILAIGGSEIIIWWLLVGLVLVARPHIVYTENLCIRRRGFLKVFSVWRRMVGSSFLLHRVMRWRFVCVRAGGLRWFSIRK